MATAGQDEYGGDDQRVYAARSPIKERSDFKDTPTGWYKRWDSEMTAAKKRVRKWHNQGDKIQARYADRRGMQGSRGYSTDEVGAGGNAFRVNLFNANINTMRSMLYGSTPMVDVARRFADADDDPARVSSLILNRMLNTSIESSGDDYKSTLQYSLDDRLLPGLGMARIVYECETEDIDIPPVLDGEGGVVAEGYTETRLISEACPVRYVHWDDFMWGWARTWSEVPWIAFKSFLTKDQATKRFGEEYAKQLNYKNKSINALVNKRLTAEEAADAWDRAEVWEIWDKNTHKVFWWSYGFERILDIKKDPLNLYGFWPVPEPMLANCVSNLLLPQPDFAIAQDLYNEIDELETRIGIITTAVRVVGVYDETNDGVKRMLEEGFENDLIPLKNWGAFAEKGGMDGAVDWMPLQDIVQALEKLVQQRSDAMILLQEVTGMQDILLGKAGPSRETTGNRDHRAQYASIRVQALQEEFARFASDLMCLKAEVIGKHFEAMTIIRNSNILYTEDGQNEQLLASAIALIKKPEEGAYRIEVRPESVAMVDYDKQRMERSEFIGSVATFMQAAAPLAQIDPESTPTMISLLKWAVAGFKGSQEVEGVLDRAIESLQAAAQQPQQPEGEQEPSEAELDMQAAQQKHENTMTELQTKHENTLALESEKFQTAVKEMQAELQKELKIIRAETIAAIKHEAAQSEAAMVQDDSATQNKIRVKRTPGANGGDDVGA